MKYLFYIFIYLYVTTGVFISIKLFIKPIGKILGALWYGLFWMPILIAEIIENAVKGE